MPGDAQSIQPGEIARSIESFAQAPAVGMVVVASGLMTANRETIAAHAARHRLPAVYAHTYFATSGGLVSYGSDNNDLFRRAAEYVDRILRGAKPADLPVQAPTKFNFAINPQGCQGARDHCPALAARPRGD
jgi:putative ABC transport system substrate-binding protein